MNINLPYPVPYDGVNPPGMVPLPCGCHCCCPCCEARRFAIPDPVLVTTDRPVLFSRTYGATEDPVR